jgi:DNA-binding transcriptional LysR family regulator
VLRVSAPVALGRAHVSPVCRDLVRAYPKVSVDLTLTDRLVELIDEGMDVVVRIGAPKDSGLVMRKLVDNHRIVVGAPDYLERRGTPMVPAELEDNDCLQYRGVGTHGAWWGLAARRPRSGPAPACGATVARWRTIGRSPAAVSS